MQRSEKKDSQGGRKRSHIILYGVIALQLVIIIVLVLILLKGQQAVNVYAVPGSPSEGYGEYEAIAVQALQAWYDGDAQQFESLVPLNKRGDGILRGKSTTAQDIEVHCRTDWDCLDFGSRKTTEVKEILVDMVHSGLIHPVVTTTYTANGVLMSMKVFVEELSGKLYLACLDGYPEPLP